MTERFAIKDARYTLCHQETDTMLIPFDLILIAKENPHLDWNEQMAYAVKFYDEHRDEIIPKKE